MSSALKSTPHQSTVFVRRVSSQSIQSVVRELLELCGAQALIGPSSKVVVKPNICATKRELLLGSQMSEAQVTELVDAANTSKEVTLGVVRTVMDLGATPTVIESDGMRHDGDEALRQFGLANACLDMGAKVQNLSRDELIEVDIPALRGWGLPRTLLEADVLISVPTVKTHARTYFTGSLKNLWGCVAQHDRIILLHKHLERLIGEVAALVPTTLGVMDGILGMDGRGPAMGRPVPLGILLASQDLVALDVTAMRIVGLDPARCRHVTLASQLGLGVCNPQQIRVDGQGPLPQVKFTEGEPDFFTKTLELLSRSPWFVHHVLLNDALFFALRRQVTNLRNLLGLNMSGR